MENTTDAASPIDIPVMPAVAEVLRLAHAYADAKLMRYGLLNITDPPDPIAAFAALEFALDAVLAAERDRICAAIKAEDDHCWTGDYMMDSDDCIAVVRGTWKRPDYSVGATK